MDAACPTARASASKCPLTLVAPPCCALSFPPSQVTNKLWPFSSQPLLQSPPPSARSLPPWVIAVFPSPPWEFEHTRCHQANSPHHGPSKPPTRPGQFGFPQSASPPHSPLPPSKKAATPRPSCGPLFSPIFPQNGFRVAPVWVNSPSQPASRVPFSSPLPFFPKSINVSGIPHLLRLRPSRVYLFSTFEDKTHVFVNTLFFEPSSQFLFNLLPLLSTANVPLCA